MRKITLFLALAIATFSSVQAQIPTNGLVAYYPFSGNANDASGNGNNGTVNGAKLTTDRFGNPNSAYHFDGVSSNISIPVTSNNSSFSINLWVNVDSLKFYSGSNFTNIDAKILSSFNNTTPNFNIEIAQSGGIAGFNIASNVPVNISIKTWVMVTWTYNASTITGYINGNLIGSNVNFTFNSNSQKYMFGARPNTPLSFPFKGFIDDARFYSRALAASEVTALYNENITCYQKIAVSDTLRISTILGLNSIPTSFGTVKIYPNPAHDILNISVGNPSINYSIKILNTSSQVVYTSILNTSITQLNLSTLGVNGLYFIQILNNANNVLETKKLVLE